MAPSAASHRPTSTIRAPGVAALVGGAVALYRAVAAGRWSAVVDATAPRWARPEEARAALDDLAAEHPTRPAARGRRGR